MPLLYPKTTGYRAGKGSEDALVHQHLVFQTVETAKDEPIPATFEVESEKKAKNAQNEQKTKKKKAMESSDPVSFKVVRFI